MPVLLLLPGYYFYLRSASAPRAADRGSQTAEENRVVRVHIRTKLPPRAPLEVQPAEPEIAFRPGEPFTVTLKVKNRSDKEVWSRVAHTVEPEIIARYMGLADCGAFIPFRLPPGKETENSATFLVWTDLPRQTNQFAMVYRFEVDKP